MDEENKIRSGLVVFELVGDCLYVESIKNKTVRRIMIENIESVDPKDENIGCPNQRKDRLSIYMRNLNNNPITFEELDTQTKHFVALRIYAWCKDHDRSKFKTNDLLEKISESLEKLVTNISFSVGSPEFEGAKEDFEKNTKQ